MASIEQSISLSPPAGTRQLDAILNGARQAVSRSIIIIAVLAAWELLPRLHLVEPAFLPPFSEVLATAWQLTRSGELATHIASSLSRSLLGFALAIVSGVPLGLLMGWYKGFERAVNPLLESLRNTASLALLPVFIL